MSMNEDDKKLFVDALRSGEYKQGKGDVCIWKDGQWEMCAVGVAIDVLCEADWQPRYSPMAPHLMTVGTIRYFVKDSGLCLSDHGLSIREQERLVHMNDNEGRSLEYIADWVEANL